MFHYCYSPWVSLDYSEICFNGNGSQVLCLRANRQKGKSLCFWDLGKKQSELEQIFCLKKVERIATTCFNTELRWFGLPLCSSTGGKMPGGSNIKNKTSHLWLLLFFTSFHFLRIFQLVQLMSASKNLKFQQQNKILQLSKMGALTAAWSS